MTDYRALLGELAIPRLVGAPGHTRVRGILTRELEARGFRVLEHAFAVNDALLMRVAVAGDAFWLALLALSMPVVGRALGPWSHVLVVLLTVSPAGLAVLLALRAAGVLPIAPPLPPKAPRRATILIARRTEPVTVWLTAHGDSKGQPISMATRVAAVGLMLLDLPLLAVFFWLGGPVHAAPAALLLLLPGVVGGFLLGCNRATDASPGACDNATGLLAVLAVVDVLPVDAPVGVIIPDGEELGLLGAKVLVRERANLFEDAAVINLDGLDDRGPTIAFVHRPGPTVDAVAARLGAGRFRALPILVDGLVLARAARECVTILKGNWDTARIVHTPRDTAERLTLEGVKEVARGVADVLRTVGVGSRF